jgi:hypothetical protein
VRPCVVCTAVLAPFLTQPLPLPSFPASLPTYLAGSLLNRWTNARGEGKLLSFDLVDKDGGEIRATAWNDQADVLDGLVQVGMA